MFSDETIRTFKRSLIEAEEERYIYGTIGKRETNGAYTVYVPHKPGYVYVTIQRNDKETVETAVNFGAAINPLLRVEMVRRSGELVIVRPEPKSAIELYGVHVSSAAVPPVTAPSSVNVELIQSRRFLPGLVYPSNSGMNVTVEGFFHRGGYFGGTTTLDLTSHVPTTAGHVRWCVVFVNTETNTAGAVSGTSIAGPPESLALADITNVTTNLDDVRLAAIALENGQTVVDTTTRIVDIRPFYDDVQSYALIKDETTPLPRRRTIRFTGSGVTASDSGGETVVNVPGGAGHVIYDESTPLPYTGILKFTGAGVTASDTGTETVVNIPGGAADPAVEIYKWRAMM